MSHHHHTGKHLIGWQHGGVVASAIALGMSLLGMQPFTFDVAWVAVLFCGVPIVREAVTALICHADIKAGLLVSLALVAALSIGETFAAGEVAFIMQLGELLEHFTVHRARAGLARLSKLIPDTARRLSETGGEEVVTTAALRVGERVRVLPGERVPVDGVVLAGKTTIDRSVLTGESMPVEKSPGDTVMSGTMNQFGAFEMRVERVESESAVQRLAELTASADAHRARIVRIADKWATVITVAALSRQWRHGELPVNSCVA